MRIFTLITISWTMLQNITQLGADRSAALITIARIKCWFNIGNNAIIDITGHVFLRLQISYLLLLL